MAEAERTVIKRLQAKIQRLEADNAELLAALVSAETWLDCITDEVLDGEGSRPYYAADCEKIRIAIANHEGAP